MSGYTPGPWYRNIPPAAKYATIFAGRNTHVCVLTHTNKDVEGNADLIAAAPDMAEALRNLLTNDSSYANQQAARAALAKAGL